MRLSLLLLACSCSALKLLQQSSDAKTLTLYGKQGCKPEVCQDVEYFDISVGEYCLPGVVPGVGGGAMTLGSWVDGGDGAWCTMDDMVNGEIDSCVDPDTGLPSAEMDAEPPAGAGLQIGAQGTITIAMDDNMGNCADVLETPEADFSAAAMGDLTTADGQVTYAASYVTLMTTIKMCIGVADQEYMAAGVGGMNGATAANVIIADGTVNFYGEAIQDDCGTPETCNRAAVAAGGTDCYYGDFVPALYKFKGWDLPEAELVEVFDTTLAAAGNDGGAEGAGTPEMDDPDYWTIAPDTTAAFAGAKAVPTTCGETAAGTCTTLAMYTWADYYCSKGNPAFVEDADCAGFILKTSGNIDYMEFYPPGSCYLEEDDNDPPVYEACYTGGGMSNIYNDPKVVNMAGQQFDIMAVGTFSMLKVTSSVHDMLDVSATIDRAGSRCGATYIQNVSLKGTWMSELGIPRLHVRATAAVPKPRSLQFSTDNDKTWQQPGQTIYKNFTHKGTGHFSLSVKMISIAFSIDSHRIVETGVKTARFANFLNMNIKGANKAQSTYLVAGLLGNDDHSAAAALPAGCNAHPSKLLSAVSISTENLRAPGNGKTSVYVHKAWKPHSSQGQVLQARAHPDLKKRLAKRVAKKKTLREGHVKSSHPMGR